MEILFFMVCGIVFFYVLIFVHEMGHLTAAMLLKAPVLAVSVGASHEKLFLARIGVRQEKLFFFGLFPTGVVLLERKWCKQNFFKLLLITLAGPLTDLIIVLIAGYFVIFVHTETYYAIAFSALLLIASIWFIVDVQPIYGNSDGKRCFLIIKYGLQT